MSRAFPSSRLALNLRRLRGRFGIAAPKVAVRTHVPWHVRLASIAGAIALLAMLSGWAYDAGRKIAGFDQNETSLALEELRRTNAELEAEAAQLRGLLATNESSLQIEQAAQRLLVEKNSALATENARLKEDLAIFERLAKLEGEANEEVSLDRLTLRADAPGQYRFSFLIALQGARRGKESAFDLRLLAAPRPGTDGAIISLPREKESGLAQYKIALRNFRRIEGTFDVPADYPLGALEVRIFERGVLKASKSVSL